ncbi:DUF1150 family protein [Falsiroseomonas tokyonensis]|uniref:DUF1150 family protein n=1 Tax=Falsiroseomonas tokyonensis TaxID=430521 RepID=A0ABV7BPE8_9PROT|nr:DUF1150 family protein [Falsiroseomonas tokyonensis]
MSDFDGGASEGRVTLSPMALRSLSNLDFARLGADAVAYLRPVVLNGALAFAIHAADGTPIGAAPNADLAAAAIRQHDMEPMLVH